MVGKSSIAKINYLTNTLVNIQKNGENHKFSPHIFDKYLIQILLIACN